MMRIFDPAAIASALTFVGHNSCRRRQRHSIFSRVAHAVGQNSRRVLSVVLVVSLLATSTPAASQTIVGVAGEWQSGLAFWLRGNGLLERGHRALTGQNPELRPQERQVERDARVSRIQIYPGHVSVNLSDHVRFSAVAYDRDNTPVGGVKIKWSGQDSILGRRARISQQGDFEATTAGSFSIVAEGAGKTAAVTIVVRPGLRRDLNLVPTSTRQLSTRDLPSIVGARATD